eukprot:320882-Chlamydomonas_euryale.AAC.1
MRQAGRKRERQGRQASRQAGRHRGRQARREGGRQGGRPRTLCGSWINNTKNQSSGLLPSAAAACRQTPQPLPWFLAFSGRQGSDRLDCLEGYKEGKPRTANARWPAASTDLQPEAVTRRRDAQPQRSGCTTAAVAAVAAAAVAAGHEPAMSGAPRWEAAQLVVQRRRLCPRLVAKRRRLLP